MISNTNPLAKCLLVLPHSNADTERVFSIIRKTVAQYHTEMDQSTPSGLLSCKLNRNCDCYQLNTLKELLQTAKGATMEYNKAHSSQHKP